jgi:hypothetical protein
VLGVLLVLLVLPVQMPLVIVQLAKAYPGAPCIGRLDYALGKLQSTLLSLLVALVVLVVQLVLLVVLVLLVLIVKLVALVLLVLLVVPVKPGLLVRT